MHVRSHKKRKRWKIRNSSWENETQSLEQVVSAKLDLLLFSHQVVSNSLWPPKTAAHQASISLKISQSFPKFMSTGSVMTSNHLILCRSLLLPSVFPSIRVFSNESDFRIADAEWIFRVISFRTDLENWISNSKRMKLNFYLASYTNINSKWMKDLNARPITVKILEENAEEKLHLVWAMSSSIWHQKATKAKINK